MKKDRSSFNVNQIILDEIDKIDTGKKVKQLLKDILDMELDNMDKEKIRFKDGYKDVFSRHGY